MSSVNFGFKKYFEGGFMSRLKMFLILVVISVALFLCNKIVSGEIIGIGKSGDKYVYKVGDIFVALSLGDIIDGCMVTPSGLKCGETLKISLNDSEKSLLECKETLNKKFIELKDKDLEIEHLTAGLIHSKTMLDEYREKIEDIERLRTKVQLYSEELENLRLINQSQKAEVERYAGIIEGQQETIKTMDEDYEKTNNNKNITINSDEKAFQELVSYWKTAWEKRDREAYVNFYSQRFSKRGINFDSWNKHIIEVFSLPITINIKITDIKTIKRSDGDMVIKFLQHYNTDNYSDIGIKTLYWGRESDGWKIVKELWKPEI